MLRQNSLSSIYIRLSRYNSNRNYNIEDFFDRSLSRLELFKIIRERDIRALVRLVVEISVYFCLYSSINS